MFFDLMPTSSGSATTGITGNEVPIYELNYTQVDTYALLPAPAGVPNKIYVVRTNTGTWLLGTLKKAGLYYSNGVAWSYMGNNISIDDTIASNESVWSSSKVDTTKANTNHTHTMDELSDATISTPTNGQVLTYNTGTSQWVNSTPTTGTTDHTLLVNIGTNTHAQIDTALARLVNTSGTNTGDQDLSGLSLNTHNHTVDSLSNVVITANSDNEVLAWDSTTSKWINQTATEAGLASDTHNHTGVYEPADATILKSAAIGSTVQAYNANTTTAGNTFNGISQLVQTDVSGKLPAIDGSLLTNLPSGSDATKLPLAGGVMTGAITALRETKVAMGANDINLASGNLFTKTISVTATLTVSNWLATGNANSFILELINGGSAVITWFSGVKWAGGIAPTLTTAGVDILGFYSHDGGTTVRGMVLNKDSK